MPATEFDDIFLDEDALDDDWDDEPVWNEDDEFLDELDEIERKEYLDGYLSARTSKKELLYDYDPNDYPYGYDLDV